MSLKNIFFPGKIWFESLTPRPLLQHTPVSMELEVFMPLTFIGQNIVIT